MIENSSEDTEEGPTHTHVHFKVTHTRAEALMHTKKITIIINSSFVLVFTAVFIVNVIKGLWGEKTSKKAVTTVY